MPLLIQPVAGRYSGTFTPGAGGGASGAGAAPLDFGMLDDNGWELSYTSYQDPVNKTDAFRETILDTLHAGADWKLRARSKEYTGTVMNAAWPWGKSVGNLSPIMGVIARRGSDIAAAIVLTSTTGTPAAGNPGTLTASNIVISPNFAGGFQLTSKIREVPVEWLLLPYSSSGNVVHFTVT